MGIITSDHPDIPGMKGLHLFHFMLSNCSQRVRLGLEEKALAWTSHHLNLPANEHVTSDYVRINPNAVVPTLVHDGQVVIESNDILVYLDEHFPDPPLRPTDRDGRAALGRRIAASSAFQPTIIRGKRRRDRCHRSFCGRDQPRNLSQHGDAQKQHRRLPCREHSRL